MGGFCGKGGSVWVMGQWAVGQWIVGVISFQKIYGLYSVKHQKSGKMVILCELWVDFVGRVGLCG